MPYERGDLRNRLGRILDLKLTKGRIAQFFWLAYAIRSRVLPKYAEQIVCIGLPLKMETQTQAIMEVIINPALRPQD